MFVVIVGSREWQGQEAEQQVNALLDRLRQQYSGMVIVTSSTDKGVGAMIRDRCMKDKQQFEIIDVHIRIGAKLPRAKLAQVFYARNELLCALGEEFHVFVNPNRKGSFEDLIEKLQGMAQQFPRFTYLPEKASQNE